MDAFAFPWWGQIIFWIGFIFFSWLYYSLKATYQEWKRRNKKK